MGRTNLTTLYTPQGTRLLLEEMSRQVGKKMSPTVEIALTLLADVLTDNLHEGLARLRHAVVSSNPDHPFARRAMLETDPS